MRRLLALSILSCAVPAYAEPCVSGDPALVDRVSEVLAARGVTCDTPRARIERRGEQLVVATDAVDGVVTERAVGDPTTAATVIESWARADIAEPLLAIRPVAAPAPEAMPVREIVTVARPESRGVQLFAAAETSFGSDHTGWLGAQVGGCVMIGPVCAAARLRFASVATGPGPWQGALERRGTELLVGGDVPIRIGRAVLSPGFAGGIGQIHTHIESPLGHMGSETAGLRADVHATLSYPLGKNLAFDLSLAVDVTQATDTETRLRMTAPDELALPDEPLFLFRLGAGLRYGGL